MNNSKFALESNTLTEVTEKDNKPWLRQREGELVKIIEALRAVAQLQDWSSLKTLVFDGVVEKLEKDLLDQARKDNPDKLVMARLNGQLVWAKKFADIGKLSEIFRDELTRIRKSLYGSSTQKES